MATKFVLSLRHSHPLALTSGALNNRLGSHLFQFRTIVTKFDLQLPDNYPDPWPYKEKGYYHSMIHIDQTLNRIHKNSKLITVEGNIGVGRSKFAKELADELGFHHMPSFKMDDILIDRYNNDLRDYYHMFPKRFCFPDVNMFYRDPADDQTAVMQDRMYDCRWEQYFNALAHILNTGQGVVLERSVHSDFVFANAMRAKDWISKEYYNFYMFKRKQTLHFTQLYPHLVIYLESDPEQCLENIRKRGNADEINAVDLEYLTTIHNSYTDFLKEMKTYSYILTYNWATPDKLNFLLEDISKINFEFREWHEYGEKLIEWHKMNTDYEYSIRRYHVTSKDLVWSRSRHNLGRLQQEVAELYIYPLDGVHFENVVMHEILKDRCSHGYTKKDPIQGLTRVNYHRLEMPEPWVEYFWKEEWINCASSMARLFDPKRTNYDPEYLAHKH